MRLIDADTVCKKLEGYARDCEEEDDRVAGGVFLDAISEIQDAPTIDTRNLQQQKTKAMLEIDRMTAPKRAIEKWGEGYQICQCMEDEPDE